MAAGTRYYGNNSSANGSWGYNPRSSNVEAAYKTTYYAKDGKCIRARIVGNTETNDDYVRVYDHYDENISHWDWALVGGSWGYSGMKMDHTVTTCTPSMTVALETDSSLVYEGVEVTFEDY